MSYFGNIVEGVKTIFEGLTITASHLLRKPITIQYPDKMEAPLQEVLPKRYRGLLNVDMKICTGCTLCQSACPIQCIEIGIVKSAATEGTAPQRLIGKFDVDLGKCMFCGFCTEVCPTGAVSFTREFEGATKNLKDLTFEFVKGEPVAPYKKGA